MNTIDILGDEETFKNIVERTITEIEDNEVESIGGTAFLGCNSLTSSNKHWSSSILWLYGIDKRRFTSSYKHWRTSVPKLQFIDKHIIPSSYKYWR